MARRLPCIACINDAPAKTWHHDMSDHVYMMQIIRKVEEETARGRARAAEARQERLELEARKRDRLKAEFLKRRIEAAALKTKKAGTDPQ